MNDYAVIMQCLINNYAVIMQSLINDYVVIMQVLEQTKYRVDWARYQDLQKRKEEEALERERGMRVLS